MLDRVVVGKTDRSRLLESAEQGFHLGRGRVILRPEGGDPLPFLAINADRNIIAVNTFPPDANDISKFWYQCQIANTVQYVGGNQSKCADRGCNGIKDPFPIP